MNKGSDATVRQKIEQAICSVFGHGRLTISDRDGISVDICPRCDFNYRALTKVEDTE